MLIKDYIYRASSYLRHFWTSTNTMGHGIHSPYLFYLVNMVIYDDNPYYCFRELEKERWRYMSNQTMIDTKDYGTGNSQKRSVAAIASSSLSSPKEAQILFRILQELKPQRVIELGTSLGITTAYMAKSASKGKVWTLEGDPTIAKQAQELFKRLNINNIEQVIGNIDETLEGVLKEMNGQLDFAFLDANHREEATLRYFKTLLPYCHKRTILVFDDVHYSHEMGRAWDKIRNDKAVSCSFDFYDMGMVFLNPCFLRKHYRMRL